MKYEYKITGLDCANCAANLARLVRRVPGVEDADIDFMRGKLWVETAEMTPDRYAKIEMLADGFDGSVLSPWKKEADDSVSAPDTNPAHAETDHDHGDSDHDHDHGDSDSAHAEPAHGHGDSDSAHAEPAHGHGDSDSAHAETDHDHGDSNSDHDHGKPRGKRKRAEGSVHEHAHGHGHDHGHDHGAPKTEEETRSFLKREIIRISVSAVLLLLAVLLPVPFPVTLSLYLCAYFSVAYTALWNAAKNITHGRIFDENFLMTVATVGAFVLKEYAEGVFVMLFYTVGELFQTLAVGKSRKSITEMLALKSSSARVLRNGEWVDVAPESVAVGELLSVRPGEKIALDGVIENGATSLDTAALTGESKVREVIEGESVLSGSLNLTAPVEIRVTKRYQEGTVGKILELVENSSEKKAKTEKFITRFASWYTPLVVGAAVVVGLIVPLFVGDFALWVEKALVFLVVSCPCALVLSVPLSFFAGIGKMAKCGILVKGGNYVEALAKADVLLTDKTGTVTDGKLAVREVVATACEREELLTLAALLESKSNHPVARAVCAAAPGQPDGTRLTSCEEIAGYGIVGEVDGDRVLCGGKRMMERFSVQTPPLPGNGTLVCVARDGVFLGALVLRDGVKKGVKETVETLKKQGVKRAVMLTGDEATLAEEVASAVGLTECKAGLLPDEKVAALAEYQTERGSVYVGDGINDAPVLSAATVGVAMGALGSDVAVETADVVIMNDDFAKLSLARKIARKTSRIVSQNVAFSLVVKLAVMILSLLGYSNMWMAIFADVGVMVLAVINAMRAGLGKN